jgi:hypothetical protein
MRLRDITEPLPRSARQSYRTVHFNLILPPFRFNLRWIVRATTKKKRRKYQRYSVAITSQLTVLTVLTWYCYMCTLYFNKTKKICMFYLLGGCKYRVNIKLPLVHNFTLFVACNWHCEMYKYSSNSSILALLLICSPERPIWREKESLCLVRWLRSNHHEVSTSLIHREKQVCIHHSI